MEQIGRLWEITDELQRQIGGFRQERTQMEARLTADLHDTSSGLRSALKELTARILGTAARTGEYDPQTVKYAWHYIARFGVPGSGTGDPVMPA
jgi:hypothetical protein